MIQCNEEKLREIIREELAKAKEELTNEFTQKISQLKKEMAQEQLKLMQIAVEKGIQEAYAALLEEKWEKISKFIEKVSSFIEKHDNETKVMLDELEKTLKLTLMTYKQAKLQEEEAKKIGKELMEGLEDIGVVLVEAHEDLGKGLVNVQDSIHNGIANWGERLADMIVKLTEGLKAIADRIDTRSEWIKYTVDYNKRRIEEVLGAMSHLRSW